MKPPFLVCEDAAVHLRAPRHRTAPHRIADKLARFKRASDRPGQIARAQRRRVGARQPTVLKASRDCLTAARTSSRKGVFARSRNGSDAFRSVAMPLLARLAKWGASFGLRSARRIQRRRIGQHIVEKKLECRSDQHGRASAIDEVHRAERPYQQTERRQETSRSAWTTSTITPVVFAALQIGPNQTGQSTRTN